MVCSLTDELQNEYIVECHLWTGRTPLWENFTLYEYFVRNFIPFEQFAKRGMGKKEIVIITKKIRLKSRASLAYFILNFMKLL